MSTSSSQEPVTVGIVGGGIGGLALAKMLEMAGVSYRLFEAYELVPEAGASIGLMPSGLRILDQIGVIDEIEKWSVNHDCWDHRDGITGELYTSTKAARAYPDIFGYGSFFMDRRRILSIIFDSIQDKSRLHAFKKIVAVENRANEAIIKAASGENFSCQVVAGADGVHSIVRKFLRQELPESPKVSPDYLSSDTYCVFGISASVSSIGEGRHFTIYQPGASLLVFSGLGGKLYWFIFKPFEEPLKYSERRRYTQEDTQAAYALVADALVTDDMAPHAAMGANLAFESAACFVNKLVLLRDEGENGSLENLSQDQLTECFESYTEQRRDRVTALTELARTTQEIQLRIGPKSDAFIKALPETKERDWMTKAFISLSQAEKLQNWKWDSERVAKYDSVAAEILHAKEQGTENAFFDSIMESLAVN